MVNRAFQAINIYLLIAAVVLSVCFPLSSSAGQTAQVSPPLTREFDSEDRPGEAAEFHLLKRAPAGQSALPVERYLAASARIKRMRRYSTALRMMLPARGALTAQAENALDTWVPLGPGNIGGRTRALLIDPRNAQVMYAAGVAGGVWKSTNAGAMWSPLDDLLPNLAVSSMAIDPTNADCIYAGTGEGFQNGDSVRGAGIFKTTDGGASWTHLSNTINSNFHFVNDIVVSRNNPQQVYAATRAGIWQSTDGGVTWALAFDPRITSGCLDLAIRTDQPTDHIVASFGNMTQGAVYLNTNASGGGAWTSVLTEQGMGRTSLAIAPSNQDIVYALAMNVGGGEYQLGMRAVFKSTDGGATWTARVRNNNSVKLNTLLLSSLGAACGSTSNHQGWYDNVIAVDPADPERVWAGGVGMFRSDDGGASWGLAQGLHADQHAIVFHPNYNGRSNRTMFVGNDGGIYRTDDARAAVATSVCSGVVQYPWTPLNNNYGVTQFYHGAPFPDGRTFIGGTQDNGTVLGTNDGGVNSWRSVFGGDGGYVAIDPNNPNIVYIETQRLAIRKSTDGGFTFRSVITGIANTGFLFIVPYVMDPGQSERLWTGGGAVWRTVNGADNWTQASAPLNSGSVSALAVAPTNSNAVMVGTSSGFIHRTNTALAADEETEWAGVSPRSGFVSWVAFDPANPNIAYATYSTFNRFPNDQHIYRSTDAGATWTGIDGTGDTGIPDIPVHTIVIDPTNTSRLYIGTDLGVFVSLDGGATWARENSGFANTPTESLALNTADDIVRLFAFTHGRGAFRVRLAAFVSRITVASVEGKKLMVTGEQFDRGARILIDGEEVSTKNDGSNPKNLLVAKKGGKKIASGQMVSLRVRNNDGTLTPPFSFMKP